MQTSPQRAFAEAMFQKLRFYVIVAFGCVIWLFLGMDLSFSQTADRLSFQGAAIAPSKSMSATPAEALSRKTGVSFAGAQVEFNSMSLRDLIIYAYGINPAELSGPEWLSQC